jgi:hypothetical protein
MAWRNGGTVQTGGRTGQGNNETGVNQTVLDTIRDVRQHYDYPDWFENTMNWAESGKISYSEFSNAYNNLLSQNLITPIYDRPNGDPHLPPSTSNPTFESLYPKQTSQLIKMGKDMTQLGKYQTELGDIAVRQDETIGQHRSELDAAKLHRDINQEKADKNAQSIQDLWNNLGMKANIDHTHARNGKCEWYDLGCKMNEGFEGLGKLALIGGAAIIGIWLLKMRLRK